MGQNFIFQWFNKTVTELKAILETDKNLSEADRAEIEAIIKEKEKDE